MTVLLFLITLLTPITVDEFIDLNKDIAIKQMWENDIPASIIMAQAIVETGWGEYCEGNNYFGIKVSSDWEGETHFRAEGEFKSYLCREDSFSDHSKLILDEYKELLEYQYDYNAWAYGLQELGYAEDCNYARKIIFIINRYELYHLDYCKPYRTDWCEQGRGMFQTSGCKPNKH